MAGKAAGNSARAMMKRPSKPIYSQQKKGEYLTRPLITGPGKLNPAFREDENLQHAAISRPGPRDGSAGRRPSAQRGSLVTGLTCCRGRRG
jgi:hypothetical protein